ncbi:MAG: hypothetical protein JJE01_04740 [Gemmatimonadetes bacterium]|nr:hypothetical protein [Gemmatimonadota bacterium]
MSQDEIGSITDGDQDRTPELPSLPIRIVQVFTAPATLFDALKTTPKWIGAAVVVIVLGLVVQALIPAELIREMALSSLPSDAPPEQVAAVEKFMGVSNIIRWVGTVVFPILMILFVSGFILLVWNAILGGEAAFPAVLACAAHSYIVWAAGGLITMPLVLARQDLRTTFSLHLLTPWLDSGTYAYRFMAGLNLFGIWTMILLGVAVSRLYPKVSAASASTVMIGAYVVFKAIGAIFSPM